MVNLLSGMTPIRVFKAKKLPEAKSLVSDKSEVCVKLSILFVSKVLLGILKKNNTNRVVF